VKKQVSPSPEQYDRNLYRRDFWPITKRDLAVIGYVVLREWTSLPGFVLRVPAPAEASPQARTHSNPQASRSRRLVQVSRSEGAPFKKNPLRIIRRGFSSVLERD
jgi:hypothetical protein